MSNPLQIVDVTNFNQSTADKLLDAATTQGFLFIEGHGFSQAEVDALFELSHQFFALPVEYKTKYSIDSSNHGYVNYGGESLDPSDHNSGDPKEALNFAGLNFLTGLSTQAIPDWFTNQSIRQETISGAIRKLHALSIKLLQILALGLKIEDTDGLRGSEWFTAKYDPSKASGSTFRFLHYPGQKSLSPEAVIRAGAHTDYGSMTLLFQRENQEGLEINSQVSGEWEPVPYVPATVVGMAPPLVVNIGDQLNYWTGGLLKSTVHRVKFPAKVQETGQDRYSIAFFSHPNDETVLEPVPSQLTRGNEKGANNNAPITAAEHLKRRLAATYGWDLL